MRHYEIVLMVRPDQGEQLPTMLERYKAMITTNGGIIHRQEDWGRRALAYEINKMKKAWYVCLNVEIGLQVLRDLEHAFKFNDSVIRHMVVAMDKAHTEPSVMMRNIEKEKSEALKTNAYGNEGGSHVRSEPPPASVEAEVEATT